MTQLNKSHKQPSSKMDHSSTKFKTKQNRIDKAISLYQNGNLGSNKTKEQLNYLQLQKNNRQFQLSLQKLSQNTNKRIQQLTPASTLNQNSNSFQKNTFDVLNLKDNSNCRVQYHQYFSENAIFPPTVAKFKTQSNNYIFPIKQQNISQFQKKNSQFNSLNNQQQGRDGTQSTYQKMEQDFNELFSQQVFERQNEEIAKSSYKSSDSSSLKQSSIVSELSQTVQKSEQKSFIQDDGNEFEDIDKSFKEIEQIENLFADHEQELLIKQQQKRLEEKRQKQKKSVQRWKTQYNETRKQMTVYKELDIKSLIKITTAQTDEERYGQITRFRIGQLFLVKSFTQLTQTVYVIIPPEDPFYLQAYKYVFHLVKNDLIYYRYENNISQMKTFIVRRILDDFVAQKLNLTESERRRLEQPNRRLSNSDRQNYQTLKIDPPKSRMDRPYLKNLFLNKEFRQFYSKYLGSEKLRYHMRSNNYITIEKFQRQIFRIGRQIAPLENKMERLKRITKKPFVNGNIIHFQAAAKTVLCMYR